MSLNSHRASATLFDRLLRDCRAAAEDLQRADQPLERDRALETVARGFINRYVDIVPGLAPITVDLATTHPSLAFLSEYPFTPAEAASPDEATAVDPEMVGRVCEHLAHTRAQAGIFYTPRAEIDLMGRLALVEWLAGRVDREHEPLLDAVVFAATPEAQAGADAALADVGLWPTVDVLLRQMTMLDPACGSGSFLIGMLRLLDDLLERADLRLGRATSPFARRAHLVVHCLYGADAMPWAVEVARLRLLAALFAESDAVMPAPNVHLADALLDDRGAQFDIVIGNPPYVRQEFIRAPRLSADDPSIVDPHAYKALLARSIYVDWPLSFGYAPRGDRSARPARPLDLKSDLYAYFFFRGLSSLKPDGVLCFLTSNAWLDVGYGRRLREFLLTHGDVRLVLEHGARRSFAGADVNTAISLLGPATDAAEPLPEALGRTARFVTLAVPFEQALHGDLWTAIRSATTRSHTDDYRVCPITQEELWREGPGGGWGGRYLRAPDVYGAILARCHERLVPLGDLADVRFGLKTGANAFFHLDEHRIAGWGIEPEYLAPFLFSLKEVTKYEIDPVTLRRRVFLCRDHKAELAARGHIGALRYIEAGEAQGFHRRPSVRARALWYALPAQPPSHFVSNRFLGERFGFPWIGEDFLVGDVFFCGRFRTDPPLLGAALLNSTLSYLSAEVNARKTYGIGVAYLYGPEINRVLLPRPGLFDAHAREALIAAFAEMRRRPLLKVFAEMDQADRRALDEIVFDALGLTVGERDALRTALLDLVAARLTKAASLA